MLLKQPTKGLFLVNHEQIEKDFTHSEDLALVYATLVHLLYRHENATVFDFVHQLVSTLCVLGIHEKGSLVRSLLVFNLVFALD